MVELGSMHITGTIDTKEIDRGLTRIDAEMKGMSATTKGVQSDWTRLEQSTKGLVNSLGLMAITGTTAMVALAKGAPALAPAMASIEVSMMGLKFALGEALRPAFEWMSEKLQWLVGWAQANPDIFGAVVTSIGGLAIAFTAFKVGGLIFEGVGAVTVAVTALSGLLTNPVFLAGVAALTALLILWAATRNLAKSAEQADALRPYGAIEKSYSPGEMSGSRQFSSVGTVAYDQKTIDAMIATLAQQRRQNQLINWTNAQSGAGY